MKQPYRNSVFYTFLFCLSVVVLCAENPGICQGWSKTEIQLLPDSCFALVEVKDGQKIRRCPHHDSNGKLDEEQLIYVLGALDNETWVDQANKEMAEKHLKKHYDKFIAKVMKKGLHDSVNINSAGLTKLVALPQIGPVLAVKIVEYRKSVSSFEKIEQIKKVEGIGSATFNAIKHYICVK
ncbi:MAG: helix-hairpin-helix domain-containing protein [Desulfosarcina sp.]|nr:helix-hairpin-helix domain-containing protein [Desulfobacterales bacterium]